MLYETEVVPEMLTQVRAPGAEPMALVVFLKGINVGGHRRLRPSTVAKHLRRFGVVSIGAAGTFVVRKPVSRARIRTEISARLAFETEAAICTGKEILLLLENDPFRYRRPERNLIPFVGIMARRRQFPATLPLKLPADGDWCVKVLRCEGRFVLGLHYRRMKAIALLGQLEKMLGLPITFRSWSTMVKVGQALRSS